MYVGERAYRTFQFQPHHTAYTNAYRRNCFLPPAISEQVWKDNIFVSDEEWDRINGKALIDTEIIDAAADVFVDTNLKVNGVSDGKISYNRVVRLLLQYYRKNIH